MSHQNTEPVIKDFAVYAWKYFHYHASQRLTTFNFYIIICSLVATGYLTAIKDIKTKPLGIALGVLLLFLSFVFWKLDLRNKQMIKNAEEALKHLEAQSDLPNSSDGPHVLRIFTYEEAHTAKLRSVSSVWPWEWHLTYSKCFNIVFVVFSVLGILGVVYAVCS